MLLDSIKNVPHVEEKIFDAIKAAPAPVVLWGAGEIAWCVWTYLRQRGIEPVCFCDNNPVKQGTVHLGLPVYDYESLRRKFSQNGEKYHIVVATGPQYKDAIFSQLAAAHEENPIWYLRGYEVCGEKINYPYVREHSAKFEEAYSLLSDEFSRKVFRNVLNAKLSGDFALYEEVLRGSEYFDEEVVRLTNHEVFLDVGAYKGNAVVEFAKRTGGKYDGIIAFEPDKKTFTALQSVLAKNNIKKIETHNKGAWNKQAFLHFHDGREGGSRLLEISGKAFSATSVEMDTIDNILHGQRVTYISMDIEGSEHYAIIGAEQAIKKWKPKMAVCVYHKREDLFDIPLLLKSIMPEYKFYLRHYTNNQTETILYAV